MNQLMFRNSLAMILVVCLLASCNNNDPCDPSATCNTVEPTTANLKLKVTINDENQWVPISIYYGDVSDSALYFRDTVNTASFSYVVPIDKKYGVMVKYRRGNATILAVDGGRTSLSTDDNCDITCYTVSDLSLRMKLAE